MAKDIKDDFDTDEERRRFLRVSAKIATIFATVGAAGIGGSALAADDARAVKEVLDIAIKTKDINKALKMKGRALSKETRAALRKLDPQDLRQIAQLEHKLRGIKIKTDGGTGVIIY